MLDIVYCSITGNTERFVKKLLKQGYTGSLIKLDEISSIKEYQKDFIVIIPTFVELNRDSGRVIHKEQYTEIIDDFLGYGDNVNKCRGLVGTGDKNFAQDYIWTAKMYSNKYNLPIIYDFEKAGMNMDVLKILKITNKI